MTMQPVWDEFTMRLASILAVCLVVLSTGIGEAQSEKNQAKTAYFLKSGTIHPADGTPSFKGSILISDGKIAAVGPELSPPKDAQVINLNGQHITPGLIDCRGKLWLTSQAASESGTKGTLNVLDGIDLWTEDWKEPASQGVTSVYVQPSSTSFLGGYGALLKVAPHDSIADLVIKEKVAVQCAVGLTGKTSKDRIAQVSSLEKQLEAAKKAIDKKAADEKKAKEKAGDEKSKASKDAKTPSAKAKKPGPDKEAPKEQEDAKKSDEKPSTSKEDNKEEDEEKDPTKLLFQSLIKKETTLNIELHHPDVLERVLKLVKKYEIRAVFGGLSKVGRQAENLIDSGTPIVIGPLYSASTPPAYRKDANFDWFKENFDRMAPWSVATYSNQSRGSRLLRFQAAAAIQHGASSEQALASITSVPARMLGVADQVGSIKVGMLADLAVFSGDPMNPATPVCMTFSGGEITFESQLTEVNNEGSEPELVDLPGKLPTEYSIKTNRLLVDGKFKRGTIHVRDGKIVSTSKAGSSGPVFDLKDTCITPGLVAASSTLGQSSSIIDNSESDMTHLRAVDAIDPTTKQARQMLHAGFIHIGVSPGRNNTSAGAVGHVRLGASDYVSAPVIASQFVVASSARNANRYPASLNGQVQMLSQVLNGKPGASRLYVSEGVGLAIQNEKVQNIHELRSKQRMAVFVADSKLELRSAISLIKKNDIRASLMTAGWIGDFIEELKKEEIGIIVLPSNGLEFQTWFAEYDEVFNNDVKLAFAGESPERIRMTASLMAATGIPHDAVLNALTASGAELAGMKGTDIAKGNPADFVIWPSSPVDATVKPTNVIVDGQLISEKN